MNVLVINAGSSSLKYQLLNPATGALLAKGLCERIGIDGHLKHTPLVGNKKVFEADIPMPTHAEAIAASIDKLVSPEYGVISSMSEIDAVSVSWYKCPLWKGLYSHTIPAIFISKSPNKKILIFHANVLE